MNKTIKFIIIVLAVIGTALLFGYNINIAYKEKVLIDESLIEGSVTIIELDPPISQILKAGETIEIKAKVNYDACEGAKVSLLAQSDRNGLTTSDTRPDDSKGSVNLKVNFVVPSDTNLINIYTAVYCKAGTETRIVDSRTYKVEK